MSLTAGLDPAEHLKMGRALAPLRESFRRSARFLLVGDESALPAMGTILEALPEDVPADVLVEMKDRTDELALTSPARPLRVHWLHRGDAPAGQLLEPTPGRAGDLPGGAGVGGL